MTTDEFERILAAFKNMRAWNLNGEHVVPIRAVIEVIHSQLDEEDRESYVFHWDECRWERFIMPRPSGHRDAGEHPGADRAVRDGPAAGSQGKAT